MKKCPFCAEEIQDEAIVCRYCGKGLTVSQQRSKNDDIRHIKNNFIFGYWLTVLIDAILLGLVLFASISNPPLINRYILTESEAIIVLFAHLVIVGLVIWFGGRIRQRGWVTAICVLFVFGTSLIVYSAMVSSANGKEKNIKAIASCEGAIPQTRPANWVAVFLTPILIFVCVFLLGDFQLLSLSSSSPTSTPIRYAAVAPTVVPTVWTPTKEIISAQIFATPIPECSNWSTITLQDLGKKDCVEGYVSSIYNDQVAYYIRFGKQDNDFYLVSYGWHFPNLKTGDCVRAKGTIKQLGLAPVIVLDENQNGIMLYLCE